MVGADGAVLVERSDDAASVEGVLDSIAGHLNAQHGRMVSVAVWLLANKVAWQGDGLWTPESFLRWKAGLAESTAQKVVDIARRVDEFPECVAAMQRGELTLDQVAPIVRHAPGWCDAQMSGLAPRCSVAQISKMARKYPWDLPATGVPAPSGSDDVDESCIPDHDTPDAPVARPAADEAWFGWDDHGRFRLNVNVGADSGTMIEAALTEARDSLFQAGGTSVATVDAVIELAERSLDTVASPTRRNRYRVNVHLADDGSVTDGRGRPMPNAAADRITCDALLSPIRWEGGVPVSVGRSQHIVPDRTRRIVEHRDGGCRVPGCNHDRFVEVHHIVHWSKFGPTDTWNLVCLCPQHHRLHHQGRLGIEGNADLVDGVRFTDANGKVLLESGARPKPPGAPPPTIRGIWEHPLGERLDFRWLYFNDDPQRPPPLGSIRRHRTSSA